MIQNPAFPGPKYGPGVRALSLDAEPLRRNASPDFWNLIPYYVPQQDSRSCSAASFVMMLNAFDVSKGERRAEDRLIDQKAFLKLMQDWKPIERFFGRLIPGKTISLEEFGGIATEALKRRGYTQLKVEVIHAEGQGWRERVEAALKANESSAKDLILANFLQSELTGDPEGKVGHVAPVGAYDSRSGRVLILDPDREYYEPYWVTLGTFLKGLETRDSDAGRNRGILWIHP
jgi:hypothetical protein